MIVGILAFEYWKSQTSIFNFVIGYQLIEKLIHLSLASECMIHCLLFTIHSSDDFPLKKHSESLIQPKILPCPVCY